MVNIHPTPGSNRVGGGERPSQEKLRGGEWGSGGEGRGGEGARRAERLLKQLTVYQRRRNFNIMRCCKHKNYLGVVAHVLAGRDALSIFHQTREIQRLL